MTRSSVRSVVVLLLITACGTERVATEPGAATTTTMTTTTTTVEPIVLTRSGSCGDAYFWVANEAGEVAVTVFVDVRDRSATQPATVSFDVADVADEAVEVEVLRGSRDMTPNFCNDVISAEAEPTSTIGVVSGTGRITVGPRPANPMAGCGVEGTVVLDGIVAADGTTFAPISTSSTGIGCYAG